MIGARARNAGRRPCGGWWAVKLSVWIKLPYTLFVGLLVPVYWLERGPANFLWASDIALLAMVPALWCEQRLVASMMAVGVLIPEIVWSVDFLVRLLTGADVVGFDATGYMFDAQLSLRFRALSLFHVLLPALLVWTVHRLGYDRRALLGQTLLAWAVLPACYAFTDPARNINWVFGFGDPPQTFLPGFWHVAFLMVTVPVLVYWPTHAALNHFWGARA